MASLIKLTFILPLILLAKNGESVYCELDRNEYYIQQADICKKCDICPQGYGKAPIEDINFEISPEHGTTGCLRCVKCVPGKTFSKSISHKQCRTCKNCTALNKMEKTSCTSKSNTKCMNIRRTQSSEQSAVTPVSRNNTLRKEGSTDNDTNESTLIYVLGSIIMVLIIVIILIVSVYCNRSRCRNTEDRAYAAVKGDDTSSSGSSTPSSTETEIEIDGSSVNQNVGQQNTEQTTLFTEKAASLDKLPITMNTECDESDFLKICKPLGVKSEFANLGRKLGVPDVDIQLIREQYIGDLQEQAFQTLLKWKQLSGKSATKTTLYNIILSIDRKDIAQTLIS